MEDNDLSPNKKVEILKKHLLENVEIDTLSRKYNIPPSKISDWKKTLFNKGTEIFNTKRGPDPDPNKETKKIKDEINTKNQLIEELKEDNEKLRDDSESDYSTFG